MKAVYCLVNYGVTKLMSLTCTVTHFTFTPRHACMQRGVKRSGVCQYTRGMQSIVGRAELAIAVQPHRRAAELHAALSHTLFIAAEQPRLLVRISRYPGCPRHHISFQWGVNLTSPASSTIQSQLQQNQEALMENIDLVCHCTG